MITPPNPFPTIVMREDITPIVQFLTTIIGNDFVKRTMDAYTLANKFYAHFEPNHPFEQGLIDWFSFLKTGSYTKQLITLTDHAMKIRVFRDEWGKLPPRRKEFVGRLLNSRECPKLLFEVQMGFHFLSVGYPVSLVFNDKTKGKKLDLEIHRKNSIIGVECTKKERKMARLDSATLIRDLLATIKEKAESGYDFKIPRVLCIELTELFSIFDMDTREKLGRELQARFEKEKKKYSSISLVLINSEDRTPEIALWDGSSLYSKRPLNVGYSNPHAKYPLPPDFHVAFSA